MMTLHAFSFIIILVVGASFSFLGIRFYNGVMSLVGDYTQSARNHQKNQTNTPKKRISSQVYRVRVMDKKESKRIANSFLASMYLAKHGVAVEKPDKVSKY